MNEIPVVTACYDHLSGVAGARLTERFLELGWITHEPNAGVTPAGWQGFGKLGINLSPLLGSRRRAVAFCVDPNDREEHLGGFVGALVRNHFTRQGWLKVINGELVLTPEGEQALHDLGVSLGGTSH